jgi:cell fate regulator YaaT (PSP1 superfamily)
VSTDEDDGPDEAEDAASTEGADGTEGAEGAPGEPGRRRRRRRRRRRGAGEGGEQAAAGDNPNPNPDAPRPSPPPQQQQQPRRDQPRRDDQNQNQNQQQQRARGDRNERGTSTRPPREERRREDRRDQPRPERADRPPRPEPRADGPVPTPRLEQRRIDAPPSSGGEEPDDDTSGVAWGTDEPGPAPAITLAADLPLDPPADEPDPSTADLDRGADRFADLVNLVGVRLQSAGRIYWCDAHDLALERGERVIVDGEKGPRLATVAIGSSLQPTKDGKLRRVTRRANANDLRAETDAATAGADLLRAAKDRVRELRIPAKVFRVERFGAHRGGRVIVYFTSDDRVELREVVRDLGTQTGARVELRQIGVRDEAKLVGGIGTCGLELCCTTWLPEFVPVSIKMAKDQGMVLSPTKVSGQCGRLKCCLVYEQATYAELRKGLPKLGKRVITARGEGRVVEVDVLRGRVRVGYGPGDSEVLPGAEVKPMFPSGGQGGGPRPGATDAPEADDAADPSAAASDPSIDLAELGEMPTDDPSALPSGSDDLD